MHQSLSRSYVSKTSSHILNSFGYQWNACKSNELFILFMITLANDASQLYVILVGTWKCANIFRHLVYRCYRCCAYGEYNTVLTRQNNN